MCKMQVANVELHQEFHDASRLLLATRRELSTRHALMHKVCDTVASQICGLLDFQPTSRLVVETHILYYGNPALQFSVEESEDALKHLIQQEMECSMALNPLLLRMRASLEHIRHLASSSSSRASKLMF